MSTNTLIAIAVTAELTGAVFSRPAIEAMEKRLDAYPEKAVLDALERCQTECRRPVTLGDIIDRITGADGRPPADEAWAIAINAYDETETVVWTEEMAVAFAIAKPIIDSGDDIGARMAFRAAYDRRVAEARAEKRPPAWTPSLGTDPERRQQAITRAAEHGLIHQAQATAMLPAPMTEDGRRLMHGVLALVAKDGNRIDDSPKPRDEGRKRFDDLRTMLQAGARK